MSRIALTYFERPENATLPLVRSSLRLSSRACRPTRIEAGFSMRLALFFPLI